jgi:hypothetical protein
VITLTQLRLAAAIALVASLALNGVLIVKQVRAELDCQKRLSEARLEATIAAKDTTIRIGAEIAADRAEERDRLLADLRGISERGRADRESYIRVMERLKVLEPSCGPGQARVDAYNDTMGSAP